MNVIELRGCRFEPLFSYFKALGVLRAISMQKDDSVRGLWKGNIFVLYSKMSAKELISFFLDEYKPSPVFSPWNKASGFYPQGKTSEAVEIIKKLRDSKDDRLDILRNTIRLINMVIKEATGKKPEDIDDGKTINKYKNEILACCRNTLPDEVINWLDVVYGITLNIKKNRSIKNISMEYDPIFAIIMVSGGNDGRLEFSVNYLKSICYAFIELDRNKARIALESSLFGKKNAQVTEDIAIGFFHPGGVEAPNATEGFVGKKFANPWDYILMIEGILLLTGSVSRRMSRETIPKEASFPFSVTGVCGGSDVIFDGEFIRNKGEKKQRVKGEIWLPLWEKPYSLKELKYLFSEGRARLGRKTAADGLDFARAVATLGVSRGIDRFIRYGIYKRSGDSYLAVPLSLMPVREKKLEDADLFSDIDYWLSNVRTLATDKNRPIRARKIPRLVYDSIFKYLEKADKPSFQRILVCLGKAEMVLSTNVSEDDAKRFPPLNLRHEWAEIADDGTPEFRLAYALAGIGWTGADSNPVRMDLQPVDIRPGKQRGHRAYWSDRTRKTVPYVNDPIGFLVSILERRCVEGKKGERDLVPIGSVSDVYLEDIQRFLEGSLDYKKIIDLFLGLILINDLKPLRARIRAEQQMTDKIYELPRDYILLKACHLPEPILIDGVRVSIPYDLRIGSLLRARRLGDACSYASRKLKGLGIVPISDFGKEGIDPMRLYASLLIPIDVREFAGRALPLIMKRDLIRVR